MERGCSQSLRRPRTKSIQKPRLGSYLFLELDKANGLHTYHEKDVVKATVPQKKGAFLQENAVPRKKLLVYGSSHRYNTHKSTSKAEEGTENQTFKATHRKDKQKGLHDLESECFRETREPSHGSSESNADGMLSFKQNVAGSKRRTPVNTKDLDNLVRQSHVDKVSCTPSLSSRSQSHRRRVVPRKFYDDDVDKDRCFGQKDIVRGQNSSRNVCQKYNVELVGKSEVGFPSQRKPNTKYLENKVLKKGSPFKSDEIAYQSDEGAYSIQETEKGGTTRESPCVSGARRHQRHTHIQEITPDRDDGQNYGDESSGEDVTSGSNDRSTPELEQSMHMDCGFGNRGALDVKVPTVRKSSRVPKKRIFDDEDEAPLRRQRKKIESEPAIEHAEEEESTEGTGNKLTNERELPDMVGDDQLIHECGERERLENSNVDEPFLDEKDLHLTARQRALKINKEGGDPEVNTSTGSPNRLQPPLPKRLKENLTEAEQAIKKEEAARRRKQQMEKNAKEIQAVAIQKILGQESSRKKREEKLQKQRQEIEQVKQAAAMAPAVNSIRWVMGPSGNVVSFSQDVELPKIFSGPCSYPQEREKCAGPSCNNVYKYRDSKTRLPLCSLQCYRAVQELPSTGPAF